MPGQQRIRTKPKSKSVAPEPDSQSRLLWVVGASAALMVYAAGGQVRAHLFPHSKASALATTLGREAPKEGFDRGSFITADGRTIAKSQDSWLVQLNYKEIVPYPEFFVELGHATGINPAEMRLGLEGYGLSELKKQGVASSQGGSSIGRWDVTLNKEQKKGAKDVYKKWQNNGVDFISNKSRLYPLGEPFADVIGAAKPADEDKDNPSVLKMVGRQGMEFTLDGFLEGTANLPEPGGKSRVKINGLTSKLKSQIESRIKSRPQDRIVELTINTELQRVAFESVRKAVLRTGAEAGCALVVHPISGDLLAAADYPVGDNGLRTSSTEITRFAPSDSAYEPGSMLKLITLAKAYTDHVIRPGETFVSTASMPMKDGRPIRNHDGKAFGTVDANDAMAHSCNVTAAKWALRIGEKSYYDFLKQTKVVSDRVGLASEGETRGLFPYGKSTRDLASLGFGQGINLTPASLAGLFGMIANGGEFIAPRLIKSIAGVPIPPDRRGTFLSPDACDYTLQAAEAVIEKSYGTGNKLKIDGIRLGGKTGTAQIIKGGKVAGYRANFVGFVPSHQPKYVVLVMIDRPKGADFYGGSIAGPVFVDITKKLIDMRWVESATPILARTAPGPLARPMPAPVRLMAGPKASEIRSKLRERQEKATRSSAERVASEDAPRTRKKVETASPRQDRTRNVTEAPETSDSRVAKTSRRRAVEREETSTTLRASDRTRSKQEKAEQPKTDRVRTNRTTDDRNRADQRDTGRAGRDRTNAARTKEEKAPTTVKRTRKSSTRASGAAASTRERESAGSTSTRSERTRTTAPNSRTRREAATEAKPRSTTASSRRASGAKAEERTRVTRPRTEETAKSTPERRSVRSKSLRSSETARRPETPSKSRRTADRTEKASERRSTPTSSRRRSETEVKPGPRPSAKRESLEKKAPSTRRTKRTPAKTATESRKRSETSKAQPVKTRKKTSQRETSRTAR